MSLLDFNLDTILYHCLGLGLKLSIMTNKFYQTFPKATKKMANFLEVGLILPSNWEYVL